MWPLAEMRNIRKPPDRQHYTRRAWRAPVLNVREVEHRVVRFARGELGMFARKRDPSMRARELESHRWAGVFAQSLEGASAGATKN